MDFESAREIIGEYCVTSDDKVREWFVKVPDLKVAQDSSSVSSVPERAGTTRVRARTF